MSRVKAFSACGRFKVTVATPLSRPNRMSVSAMQMPCPYTRSWPGLARPSTKSNELLVQIVPARVIEQDEADLPGARVVLQVLLALPCVALEIHQTLQPVPLR